MARDPWSKEQIRKLSDGVLARGVRRFRRALEHLGDTQSEHVTRLWRGLGVMKRELTHRRLGHKGRRSAAVGHGASKGLAEAAGDATTNGERAPRATANAHGEPASETTSSGRNEAPGNRRQPPNEPRREQPRPTTDRPESEPVWRLIPHLNESSSKVVSVLNEEGVIRHQSEPVKWLLGFDADALVGRPLGALVSDSSRERAQEAVARMARGEEKFDRWRFAFRTASGGTFWLEGMASNFLRDPRLGGILVYWRELAGR